jgi:hypothetical protein
MPVTPSACLRNNIEQDIFSKLWTEVTFPLYCNYVDEFNLAVTVLACLTDYQLSQFGFEMSVVYHW